MKGLKHIKFNNKTQPNSHFDLIKLEDILSQQFDTSITKPHVIEFYHILFITKGSGKHMIDFTDHPISKGDILTIRKDQIHNFHKSSIQGYILLFTEDFIASHYDQHETLKSIQLFNELLSLPKTHLDEEEFQDVHSMIKDLEKEYVEYRDEFAKGIIRSAVQMLIMKLFRIKSKNETLLSNRKYLKEFLLFQSLVEKHCLETKRVADYAKKMGCTTKTVNNIVQSILGKSAKVAIDETVILQIKRYLINTTLSVKEVAFSSGFDEPSNLYKYFKRYTGFTPEEFRALN